jgi:hypothetical protein
MLQNLRYCVSLSIIYIWINLFIQQADSLLFVQKKTGKFSNLKSLFVKRNAQCVFQLVLTVFLWINSQSLVIIHEN